MPPAAPRAELAPAIPGALAHWARERPDGLALSAGAEELGYGELHRLARELGDRLVRLGVAPGERVGLIGRNSIDWVIAFLGTLGTGAVCVPLNSRLSALELRRQVELSAARVVLADDSCAERAATATEGLATVLLGLGRADSATPSIWARPSPRGAGAPGPVAPEAPALISFTSGSTGAPKGAVIGHGALAASAGVFARALGTEQDDRTLILVPLFHNTGFVDQLSHSILAGSQVDLIAEFHVRDAIDALVRRPSSILMAVPSIFRLLMLDAHADEALRGCRAAVYGGAPMPPSWIDELKARWPAIDPVNCYGLTEFTSVSHMLLPPLSRERTDAVGMPVAGVRQTVRLESGAEAASGEVGELLVSGPMRMAGYHENETATAAAFDGDWLRTGDLVSAGDDGLVVLHGRASEVINRGGEKIHASQVAHAIAEWPGTDDVAVVGAPHEIFGEQVVAFVVASGGEGFDEDGLRSHLSERIADYAQPARVVVLDEIPRNAAGKPDQPQLRAAAATPESGRAG